MSKELPSPNVRRWSIMLIGKVYHIREEGESGRFLTDSLQDVLAYLEKQLRVE
jgi:hypothetical protein